jgi:hypothetical protein
VQTTQARHLQSMEAKGASIHEAIRADQAERDGCFVKIDWRQILGTVAPVLATAAGGPLAGVATKAIAAKLLQRPEASSDEVEAAVLGADQGTLLKLRELDQQFEKDLQAAGIKLEEIAAADRASARQRESQTGDSWTPRALAASIVLGYFAVQWFVLSHIIAAEQREIVMRSLGVLDTALGLVLGYYFGSSAGSKLKTEALAKR